jgi:hypothetical protein
MLAVFRRNFGAGARRALVRADAAAPWPLAGGRVKVVFVSRAAHLLPLALLVEETLRVASPRGALFVLGGVESDPESLRAVLRRQMRRLLAEHGVVPWRAGQRGNAGALAERGGKVLPSRRARCAASVRSTGREVVR